MGIERVTLCYVFHTLCTVGLMGYPIGRLEHTPHCGRLVAGQHSGGLLNEDRGELLNSPTLPHALLAPHTTCYKGKLGY